MRVQEEKMNYLLLGMVTAGVVIVTTELLVGSFA